MIDFISTYATLPRMNAAPSLPAGRSNDPLHGKTLQMILEELVEAYGWDGLSKRIRIKCFLRTPTIPSSLTFLRKTPWAREKVESLYRMRMSHRKPVETGWKPIDLD